MTDGSVPCDRLDSLVIAAGRHRVRRILPIRLCQLLAAAHQGEYRAESTSVWVRGRRLWRSLESTMEVLVEAGAQSRCRGQDSPMWAPSRSSVPIGTMF